MPTLPITAGELSTHDASTVTVASLTLADGFFGQLQVKLSGERDGVPATCYGFKKTVLVSCDAGVATIRSASAATEIDPTGVSGAVAATVNTDGAATIRMRITGIAAQDWRFAASFHGEERGRVGALLAALGATAYYGANYPSANEPYQDAAYTGVDLVVNGIFAADSDWTKGAGWTIPGGNIADAAGALNTALSAIVAPLTAGQRFLTGLRVAARSAGSIKVSAGTTLGTARSTLATFQESLMAATTGALAYTGTGFTGQIGSCSATRLPILTQSNSLITGGAAITQAGAAGLRPTYLPLAAAVAQSLTCPCWQFDGVGQRFAGAIPGAAGTLMGWVYLLNSTGIICGAWQGGPNRYTELTCIAGTLRFYSGTGAQWINHGTPLAIGGWHHVAATWDGAAIQIALDGVVVGNNAGGTPSPIAVWWGAANWAGVLSDTPMNGYIANGVTAPFAMTGDQIRTAMALTRPNGV
jgi:hypothetical protein